MTGHDAVGRDATEGGGAAGGGAPAVKICGVCRPEDAREAVAAGATHVGVIRVPGSPRSRTLDEAGAICAAAVGARRVGVYVDADPATILDEAARLGLDVIQLHGGEDPERVAWLRARGLEVWKVVKPAGPEDLLEAARRYADADLILVEGRSDRGHGGVGARFDWEGVGAARDRLPPGARLGVGGGLTPENVAEAIRRLHPALVDVSSGVEGAPGRKDPGRVRAFIAAARSAATSVPESKF